MPTQEDIAHQQTLLKTYRRNLSHFVKQAAYHGGEDQAPIHIANGLDDTRANIQRIKAILRAWNVAVDDQPDEVAPEAPPPPPPAKADPYPTIPSSLPAATQTANNAQFKYDVFISYSHADEDWVENTLLKALEDAGLRVCIDFRDFAVGRPSIINMQDAALESRHTVLVMTQSWIKSEWTLFESLLVRTKDPSGLTQRTIPLRLQPVELPDFISMLTWVDFTRADRHELAWQKLFEALNAPSKPVEQSFAADPTMAQNTPLPPPPRSNAGSGTQPATGAPSSASQTASPSLREAKKQALNKRLANFMAEYEAVNNQIDRALSDVDRLRLKRQAADLEQQIQEVEDQLTAL